MNVIRFEWDDNKNKANIKKHDVSFEEAKSVFYDENARLISDPDNSIEEERFVIIGISRKLKLLIVCHCYRESESVIRIISARKAVSKEMKMYGDKLL
jgi:uncharacterized DUF497 family protein